MVAFIIFGVFALVRRIDRVFLIPVLAARSASCFIYFRNSRVILCHGAVRTEVHPGPHFHRLRRFAFATTLAARSASARRPEGKGRKDLCHDAGRTECIIFDLKMENQNLNFATALAARSTSAKADKLCLYHAP